MKISIIIPVFNEGENIFRRQDSPLFFDITTSVYVASVEYIMKCESILEGEIGHVIVPQDRAIDIDDSYTDPYIKRIEIYIKQGK